MTDAEIHPEELIERERAGTLTHAEQAFLAEHRAACPACAFEARVHVDRARAEAATGAIEAERARRIAAGLRARPGGRAASRGGAPRARWLAVAAAVLLVVVGGSGAYALVAMLRARGDRSEPSAAPHVAAPAAAAPVGRSARRHDPRGGAEAEPAHVDGPALGSAEPAHGATRAAPEDPHGSVPTPAASPPSTLQAPRRPLRGAPQAAVPRPEAPQPGDDAVDPAAPSAEELFTGANRARREGRVDEAAALYAELAARHPGSREEITARVSRGALHHLQLADPRGALRHYEAYLRDAPAGVLALEARSGVAAACRSLADRACEGEALRALIAAHPASVQAAAARARLDELRQVVDSAR